MGFDSELYFNDQVYSHKVQRVIDDIDKKIFVRASHEITRLKHGLSIFFTIKKAYCSADICLILGELYYYLAYNYAELSIDTRIIETKNHIFFVVFIPSPEELRA